MARSTILSFEVDRARSRAANTVPAVYLDARVPEILHLRLVSAIHKPTGGRLTQLVLRRARRSRAGERPASAGHAGVTRLTASDGSEDQTAPEQPVC
jgi:hypothetical protein